MTRRKEAFQLAAQLGLHIDAYSPGDGVTRYRVFATPSDYFTGRGLGTLFGAAELLTFLRGVREGRDLADLRHTVLATRPSEVWAGVTAQRGSR
jgi:hypothetical protein